MDLTFSPLTSKLIIRVFAQHNTESYLSIDFLLISLADHFIKIE